MVVYKTIIFGASIHQQTNKWAFASNHTDQATFFHPLLCHFKVGDIKGLIANRILSDLNVLLHKPIICKTMCWFDSIFTKYQKLNYTCILGLTNEKNKLSQYTK